MLKKTITYDDFDGNTRTEDFYFNLTQSELVEMQASFNGGLSQLLTKIIQSKDQKQIINYFKEIILKSYGIKSLDGRQFIKNEQIREEFASTAAFSKIFMELGTNDEAAINFVKGIIPNHTDETNGNSVNGITPSAASQ